MLKLLRKDLILNRRMLAGTYAFWSALWLAFPAMTTEGDLAFGFWSGMVSVACAFMPIMILAREDKFKAGALTCSLPVTRDAIVASKYVGGWLLALTGVSVAIAAMLSLSLFGVKVLAAPAPTTPAMLIGIIGITIALLTPFVVRFGIGGVIGLLVVLQLGGVAAMMSAVLFGRRGGSVIRAVEGLFAAIGRLQQTLGPAAFSAVAIGTVLAFNIVSYRLSVSMYRRRSF